MQAFFDGRVQGKQGCQGDRNPRKRSEGHCGHYDSRDHQRQSGKMIGQAFFVENKCAEGKHHQRLDIIADAAFQHLGVLNTPDINEPVSEQQGRRGNLPDEDSAVPEYRPELSEFSLDGQQQDTEQGRADGTRCHEEYGIKGAVQMPVQRLKTPKEIAYKNTYKTDSGTAAVNHTGLLPCR